MRAYCGKIQVAYNYWKLGWGVRGPVWFAVREIQNNFIQYIDHKEDDLAID